MSILELALAATLSIADHVTTVPHSPLHLSDRLQRHKEVPGSTGTPISEGIHPTRVHSDDDTDDTSGSKTDCDFEDDVTILRDFSFISINTDNTMFTMHRLLQLTVRVWLKNVEQLERWKEQFIIILW